jgi:hypothetical protein
LARSRARTWIGVPWLQSVSTPWWQQIRVDSGDSVTSGDSTLTAVQLAMVESFAGCVVLLDAMTTRALLGEEVDPFAYCQLSSTLTRIGSRLGLTRKARTVETPSLGSYLSGRIEGDAP